LSLPEPLVTNVLVKRGAVEVRRERLTEAHTVLQDVLRRYPQGGHLAEVYYWLGTVYQRQNQPAKSIQAYEMGLAQPPTTPWTAQILWALARLQEERQELSKAIELYQRLGRDFPTHAQAETSLWQAGWLQYRQRHYQAASTLWKGFAQHFPRSTLLPRMLYWQARAAQQGGHQEVALRLYQRVIPDYPAHSYSAQAHTSLREAGVRLMPVAAKTLPITPVLLHDSSWPLETAQEQPSKARFHLIHVQELQQLQMYQLAGQEIRALAAVAPTTP